MRYNEVIAVLESTSPFDETLAASIKRKMERHGEKPEDIDHVVCGDNLRVYIMVAPTDLDAYSFEDHGFQIYTQDRVYSSLVAGGRLTVIMLPLNPGEKPVSVMGPD